MATIIADEWHVYFNNNAKSSTIVEESIKRKNAITYATLRIIQWILSCNYFNCIISKVLTINSDLTSIKSKLLFKSFIMGRKAGKRRSITMTVFWSIVAIFYNIKCIINKDIRDKMKNNKIHDSNANIAFKDALSYLRIPSEKSYNEYSELFFILVHPDCRRKDFASRLLDEFEYELKMEDQISEKHNKVVSRPLILLTTDYCIHEIYEKRDYFKLLISHSLDNTINPPHVNEQYQFVYFLEPNIYNRFDKKQYKHNNGDPIDSKLCNYITRLKKRQEELNKLPRVMDIKKKIEEVENIDKKLNLEFRLI
jgi:GNAT superfamily N-acetyltransferase